MSNSLRILSVISLFWFAQYVYVPYTTPFLLAQKVSADFVGLVIGVYGAVPLFFRFFVGVFSDKIGQYKYLILLGCFTAALGSVIRFLMPDGNGFLIANIISGFSSSMWMCFILFHVKMLEKDQLKKGMGQVFAACNIGILSGFFASATLYEHFGMSLMCILSIVAGSLGFIIASFLKETSSTKLNHPKFSLLVQVIFNKRLWFFAFIATIQQGILMATAMSFSNEVASNLGAVAWQIGIMTMSMTGSYVLSCVLSTTTLAFRIGPGILMTLSQICMALYCVLMVNVDNIYALIPVQFLLGSTGGFVFSWCNSEALSQIEDYRRSTALGLFQSAFALGMTFVPILAGYIFHLTGALTDAFYFQACLALLGAILTAIYYLLKRMRHLKEA